MHSTSRFDVAALLLALAAVAAFKHFGAAYLHVLLDLTRDLQAVHA